MRNLLDGLLPRIFPKLRFHCVPHNGKVDLDDNIVTLLRRWQEPGARFVVVRDNDNADCIELKERIRQLCRQGRREDTLIRIVCQELESWYLSEPDAMADAFGDENLRRIAHRARYRNPESRAKPSDDIRKLIPTFQKTDGARRMAQFLTRENNRSNSFRVFLNGVERLYTVNA